MDKKMVAGKVSIEQFAAFLDGNLSEAGMQTVATAIDADKGLCDILDVTMKVDDETELLIAQPETWLEEIPNLDFDLPEIPSNLSEEDNTIELLIDSTGEIPTMTVTDDEVIHLTTAEEAFVVGDGLDTVDMPSRIELPHMEMEGTFLDTPVRDGNDLMDLGEDLA